MITSPFLSRFFLAALMSVMAFATPSMSLGQDLPVPAPPVIGAKSYLVIDAHTGREIATLKADERLAPASLTKLMTAYVVFKALKEGSISLDDSVTVSEKAWRTPGSRMFIEVGTQVSVEELLLGMIVQSGNDASVALAEYVAGSESVFAEMMTQQAMALGMASSRFRNATGLPNDDHYTTARDMATVARAIVQEFPEYYEWYSVREYEYNDIAQKNRNGLLWRDDSVDGMKTGMTDDAGYCLVSSAERNGMRLISVVLGTASARSRVDGSQALLNYGFRFFETRLLYRAGEKVAGRPGVESRKGNNRSRCRGRPVHHRTARQIRPRRVRAEHAGANPCADCRRSADRRTPAQPGWRLAVERAATGAGRESAGFLLATHGRWRPAVLRVNRRD